MVTNWEASILLKPYWTKTNVENLKFGHWDDKASVVNYRVSDHGQNTLTEGKYY